MVVIFDPEHVIVAKDAKHVTRAWRTVRSNFVWLRKGDPFFLRILQGQGSTSRIED